METIKEGELARLPDGQKVRIEEVEEGWATVRRITGPYRQKLAVCRVSRLVPLDSSRIGGISEYP